LVSGLTPNFLLWGTREASLFGPFQCNLYFCFEVCDRVFLVCAQQVLLSRHNTITLHTLSNPESLSSTFCNHQSNSVATPR
jgi:hypothetical protein